MGYRAGTAAHSSNPGNILTHSSWSSGHFVKVLSYLHRFHLLVTITMFKYRFHMKKKTYKNYNRQKVHSVPFRDFSQSKRINFFARGRPGMSKTNRFLLLALGFLKLKLHLQVHQIVSTEIVRQNAHCFYIKVNKHKE